MTLISWYSISGSPLFNWLGRVFIRSFHLLERLGMGPNAFYITLICALLLMWLFIMRQYDMKAKDKGLID
jgi:hypothetical protein